MPQKLECFWNCVGVDVIYHGMNFFHNSTLENSVVYSKVMFFFVFFFHFLCLTEEIQELGWTGMILLYDVLFLIIWIPVIKKKKRINSPNFTVTWLKATELALEMSFQIIRIFFTIEVCFFFPSIFFFSYFVLREEIPNLIEQVPEWPELLSAGHRNQWPAEDPANLCDSLRLHHPGQTSWAELLSVRTRVPVGWIKERSWWALMDWIEENTQDILSVSFYFG